MTDPIVPRLPIEDPARWEELVRDQLEEGQAYVSVPRAHAQRALSDVDGFREVARLVGCDEWVGR